MSPLTLRSASAEPALKPGSADALLFDLGRVVIDIDFSKVMASWAGHAGCTPAEIGRIMWKNAADLYGI